MRDETVPHANLRLPGFWLIASLAVILLWDASGLDLLVTRWFGSPTGFAWTHHWLTGTLLHDSAKLVAWPLVALLAVGMPWPFWHLRGLTQAQRVWWLLSTLGCVLLINGLRSLSATSCPWELREFGGTVPHAISHWNLLAADGGSGRCFPSGHASTAFAFLPGWLALRRSARQAACCWLWITLAVGGLLGGVQVMRGAHFVSHVLWTGWICATASMAAYGLAPCWQPKPKQQTADVSGMPVTHIS